MKEISLTQGRVALVDDEDYEWLNQWKWCAYKHRYTFYAHRCVWNKGKKITMKMHREILGLILKDGKVGDHKDRNGLNNQKDNLRIVNNSLNGYNCKMQTSSTSGYRGVNHCEKQYGYWRVRIGVNRQRIECGIFKNILDAAKAYDKAAIKYYGDNAILNFPKRIKT